MSDDQHNDSRAHALGESLPMEEDENGTRPPALEPAILVIFGITGDLSRRKLLPALYHLVKDDLLHEHTVILGVTRRDINIDELLGGTDLCANEPGGVCDPAAVNKLRQRLQMIQMDITNGDEYDRLLKQLNDIEDQNGMCMNRLYYLSIPPQVYQPIIRLLGEHGLNQSCQHNKAMTRLLVEKPFGYDLYSAAELINETALHFKEDQIFRIDHYLAKETVQNILTFRFSNPIFNSIWGSKYIERIEITAIESIGIEGRTEFYEQVGALRDVIQSHLLQLLAVVTMEPANLTSSAAVHEAKLKVLQDVLPPPPDRVASDAVRGQYDGYRQEVDKPNSNVETFAALRLQIDNERWHDTTVLLRTGKALADKRTDIDVVFKPTSETAHHNTLTFRIQPNEGIGLDLRVKKPGFENEVQEAEMDFSYERQFEDTHGHPDAYERVLVDAVRGDRTLFATSEEVLASWRIIQPVLDEWQRGGDGLEIYKSGSWGPGAADNLAPTA